MKADETFKRYTVMGGRGSGKTYAIMKGAEAQPGCVVLTHSQQFADHLKRDFPTVDVRGPINPDKLLGLHRPVLLDHYYQEVLWDQREREWQYYVDKLLHDNQNSQELEMGERNGKNK